MIVRRARADEWRERRRLRLGALADAPLAFGSTLEREVAYDDVRWRSEAAASAAGIDEVTVVAALDGGPWTAMAMGYVDPDARPRGSVVWLVGVYTDPAHRGAGWAAAVCREVVAWARDIGAAEVRLHVGEGNAPARRTYERLGFVPTGETITLAHDPSVTELEMVLSLHRDTA